MTRVRAISLYATAVVFVAVAVASCSLALRSCERVVQVASMSDLFHVRHAWSATHEASQR